ncbi:synaptonemal complex protein 3-like isoform X2 [Schistocerca nitens]|uniref:synaptonemal complex protein 3-like isoform X2 n=1 Tax=Schistocerca nitens TaxID=7011 RepID=UPI00211813B9|nr:synaptonemal complex protein 3-like isoform X2 [Schistocerca nitens]
MPKAGFKKAPFPQKKSAVSDTISDLSDDDLLESKPVKMPIKPMENVRPVRKRAAEDKYPIQADEDTLNLNLDDEVSKMLESFESGMQRALNAKRKRLQEFASGPIKVIQNKITQLWTAQREKRKIDLNDFQENVKKVRQKWESNLDNFKEEEKKLFTLLHRHMKAAKEKYDTMKENIEMLKQLHEDFFKGTHEQDEKDQETCNEVYVQIEKELIDLQNKMLLKTQQDEIANMQNSLKITVRWGA